MAATNPSEFSTWATLLPVIVGGLIGLAGGVVGPWLLETRRQETEKKKQRAQKFEELVAALHEHRHWLDTARNVRVFNEERELGTSPMMKVWAIATVYFPDLDEDVLLLDQSADEYELWMFKSQGKKLANDANFAAGYEEPWRKYLKASVALRSRLKMKAKEDFG